MCSPALDRQPPQAAFDCRATAALLRALRPLFWASHVGAFLAVGMRWGWVALLCWLLVLYFAVRVELDAGLFELLADDPAAAPARLDDWLARAGLRARSGERSIEDRCRGARRLARDFVVAWALQMATLMVTVIRRNA